MQSEQIYSGSEVYYEHGGKLRHGHIFLVKETIGNTNNQYIISHKKNKLVTFDRHQLVTPKEFEYVNAITDKLKNI